MAEFNGKQGVWRTIGGRRVFIPDGYDLAEAMKESGKFKKQYIAEKYTPENVNDYFKNIETYEQFEEFEKDFYEKLKMVPYIVPIKHPIRQWVDFTKKGEDNEHINFWVLSEDIPYQRKTSSTIKNFVKNYKVHLE